MSAEERKSFKRIEDEMASESSVPAQLKAQIQCDGGWMAMSMTECCARLKGYGITVEEKKNGVALMCGYARLIEEAGLVHYAKTEYEACLVLVERPDIQPKEISK